jgi:hypothetical protein
MKGPAIDFEYPASLSAPDFAGVEYDWTLSPKIRRGLEELLGVFAGRPVGRNILQKGVVLDLVDTGRSVLRDVPCISQGTSSLAT